MKMQTGQLNLSRLLPKTGQVTEYEVGDDGTYQAGWWKGKTVADNKTRLIVKTISGDDVVLDRATGLMWPRVGTALGCNNGVSIAWADGITYLEALDFAGFTDWRMPNVRELMSMIDYKLYVPAAPEPPFINTTDSEYWSSTTYIENTLNGWSVNFFDGVVRQYLKINTFKIRAVRGGL